MKSNFQVRDFARRSLGFVAAAGLYSILSFLGFLPGSLSFFSDSLHWTEDAAVCYRIWWYGQVLYGDAPSYWFLPQILWPYGMPTQWQSNGFFKEWLLGAVGMGRWPWIAGNLLMLSTPVTVALTGCMVARRLFRGCWSISLAVGWFAAWTGGQIAHFLCPWMVSAEGTLVFIVLLLLLRKKVTWPRLFLAAAAAAFSVWCNLQNMVSLLVLGVVFFADGFYRRDFRACFGIVIIAVSAGLLTLPLLFPTWLSFSDGMAPMTGENPMRDFFRFRNRLSQFIIPPPTSLPFGPVFAWIGKQDSIRFSAHYSPFLGWPVLLLALLALRKCRKGVGFLAVCVLIFLFLSMGTVISWSEDPLGISGPMTFFASLPVVNTMRVVGRFANTAQLLLALMAGYGLLRVLRWKVFRAAPWRRWALVGVLLALQFYERNLWPCEVVRDQVTPYYEQIAKESGDFAVLDIPYGRGMANYIHYGAYHQKGVVWGAGGRMPSRCYAIPEHRFRFPGIVIWKPEDAPASHQAFAQSLVDYNVKYIILHENHLRKMPKIRRYILDVMNSPSTWENQTLIDPPRLVHADASALVYRVEARRHEAP